MAEEQALMEVDDRDKKTKTSLWSRVWNGLFRLHGDDFEKRLQYISKEEATLLARMNRRSSTWRATARNLIVISVFLEIVALAYAITTTRSVDLDWKMRAMRVLPIFLFPALSSAFYWALFSLTRICDSRDQKALDKLRSERQTKIDELKERTNYYMTQQLIQKYDPDPAAKAAAAAVLASKLGADSGLKVFLGDDSQHYLESTGKSNDFELLKSNGLRKRNSSDSTTSKGCNPIQQSDMEIIQHVENEVPEISTHNQVIVEHHNPTASGSEDGGWIARIAALLVGEDPSQSFALICGNCHMHNGLARKEDFPFITYFCPRCHALNRPRSSAASTPGGRSPSKESVGIGSVKSSATSSPVKTTVKPSMSSPLGKIESSETSPVGKIESSATSSPVKTTVKPSASSPLGKIESSETSPVGKIESSEKIVAGDHARQ